MVYTYIFVCLPHCVYTIHTTRAKARAYAHVGTLSCILKSICNG